MVLVCYFSLCISTKNKHTNKVMDPCHFSSVEVQILDPPLICGSVKKLQAGVMKWMRRLSGLWKQTACPCGSSVLFLL